MKTDIREHLNESFSVPHPLLVNTAEKAGGPSRRVGCGGTGPLENSADPLQETVASVMPMMGREVREPTFRRPSVTFPDRWRPKEGLGCIPKAVLLSGSLRGLRGAALPSWEYTSGDLRVHLGLRGNLCPVVYLSLVECVVLFLSSLGNSINYFNEEAILSIELTCQRKNKCHEEWRSGHTAFRGRSPFAVRGRGHRCFQSDGGGAQVAAELLVASALRRVQSRCSSSAL